jgi:nicotinamidase-related amidase
MSKRALLVLDVQNIYTNTESELYCEDSSETVKRINKVIDTFETNGSLIIYVRHVHKEDGSDLGRMFDFAGPEEDFNFKGNLDEVNYDSNLKIVGGAKQIIKNRYSSFVGTDLEKILKSNNIETVVIVGFMTNFCCESTARDAHDKDYFVDFIADATGAPALSDELEENKIRSIVSEFLENGFAIIHSTKEYVNNQ